MGLWHEPSFVMPIWTNWKLQREVNDFILEKRNEICSLPAKLYFAYSINFSTYAQLRRVQTHRGRSGIFREVTAEVTAWTLSLSLYLWVLFWSYSAYNVRYALQSLENISSIKICYISYKKMIVCPPAAFRIKETLTLYTRKIFFVDFWFLVIFYKKVINLIQFSK